MNFSSIMITGGAGYLGCQVVKDVAEKYPSARIVVVDNFSRGRLEAIGEINRILKEKLGSEFEIIPSEDADIRDHEKMVKIFDKYSPDVVIHLASIVDAFSTNRPGKDEECKTVNYDSTVSLAKLAKQKGVKTFIYQSSVSMYSRGEEITEEGEKNPLSTYGMTKLKAEDEILKITDDNFKACSLRDATLVGYTPGFTYQTIINLCCIRSLYNVPVNVFQSALEGNKTYLDVRDASKAIIFSIENIDRMNGQPFNISSFHANLKEVISVIENHLGREMNKKIVGEKTINQQVYTINSDKIKSLGFAPEGNLKKVLESTIDSLLKKKEAFMWHDSNIQTPENN